MSTLPQLPSSVLASFGAQLQQALAGEMLAMQEETLAGDETRDLVFRHTRTVQKNTCKIQFAVRTGDLSVVDKLVEENRGTISQVLELLGGDPTQRERMLSQAIEKFTEVRMMQYFFTTGRLASPSLVQPCNDDEYIGAALGFAQDLSRYVVGRACDADEASIAICRTLVIQLNAKMLEFDLRNGPVRRKYDGLKYALKSIEDVTYEMSLLKDEAEIHVGEGGGGGGGGGDEAPHKKSRTEPAVEEPLIDVAEMDAIRLRMDSFDKLREEVIKQSRDVQKLSKQGIFAVHRGNLKEA